MGRDVRGEAGVPAAAGGDLQPSAPADIPLAANARAAQDARNSRLLAVRDALDRIGYGAATPQFVNILFYLSAQASPYILLLIGLLNGAKLVLSAVWSALLQECAKLHRFSKRAISAAGVAFGFSFLVLAFALNIGAVWLFSIAFLAGTVGVVAYGDLYQQFMRDIIRRERMSAPLRFMVRWGVALTVASLLLTGLLLDAFPMGGVVWTVHAFGRAFSLRAQGYLFAFELTALSFIASGYVTSFVDDSREGGTYPFLAFLREHMGTVRRTSGILWQNRYVALLTLSAIVSGLMQFLVTAYSGIAIYKIFAQRYEMPFLALSVVYAIAVLASFAGPYFTQRVHRSIGLAPTLVFGTLLLAILPLVLAWNANVAAIAAAMCLSVVGGAIVGFAQGLLARKLLADDARHDYFRAQAFALAIPYLLLVPALSWIANTFPFKVTFLIAAAGLVLVVTPLSFWLVVVSEKVRL